MSNIVNNNDIVCFYHEYEENGCFSNWYPAEFEYAGRHFKSVEQFMMYHKVMMFHQYKLADEVLGTSDPSTIKKLGRTRFPQFDVGTWERTCYAIVKRGVRAKFEQNEELLKQLLDTGDKTLAECSLKDIKWGIGVAITDQNRFDPSKWTGRNYLGCILMEVRDELRLAKTQGKIGYIDAHDKEFPVWKMNAGGQSQRIFLMGSIFAHSFWAFWS